MEVVWIRLYTPFIGVMVYSFALILVTYLGATFLGSSAYRSFSRNPESRTSVPLAALSLFAVLPIFACQPGDMNFLVRVILGIAPFSAAVGYITPQLVDLWSNGDADRAAHAYAVNVLGCILGPLVAGLILLPRISERWSMFLVCGSLDLVRVFKFRSTLFQCCCLEQTDCGDWFPGDHSGRDREAQSFRKPLSTTRADERQHSYRDRGGQGREQGFAGEWSRNHDPDSCYQSHGSSAARLFGSHA